MARQYGVALYRDGKYEGTVAHPRAKITTWQDACILAERWRKAYAHKYQYRAVEFDAQGYLVRTEATNA